MAAEGHQYRNVDFQRLLVLGYDLGQVQTVGLCAESWLDPLYDAVWPDKIGFLGLVVDKILWPYHFVMFGQLQMSRH